MIVIEDRGAISLRWPHDGRIWTAQADARRHRLVETVPAGPTAAREAENVRTRLLNQVDERRNPRTKATLNQMLDRCFEVAGLELTTHRGYVRKLDKHVRPRLVGALHQAVRRRWIATNPADQAKKPICATIASGMVGPSLRRQCLISEVRSTSMS